MRPFLPLSAIILCLLALSGCTTLRPVEPLPVPQERKLPPSNYLAECPSLNTLATDRTIEQPEAWTVVFENYGLYHVCKSRHDYLRGWVEGQATENREPEEKPKRDWWPF